MIYSVNFLDLTEKINPLAFSKYLKETGWKLFPTKRTYLKIYQYENKDEFFQVIIPFEKRLSDYKEAMYKAVTTVAEMEKKSVEQVMLYLLNPNTDILKIRLERQDIETGNILFDDAIRMYENAKKLLAATALDILHPKKYHQGRTDDAVSHFLSSCRFGQTEIGSYVVSVVCPFAELDEKEGYKQLSIFSEEEECANSLTRKVTSRVMNNIYQIKSHIDEGDLEGLLSKDGEDIISANFYEALTGLNLDLEGTNVEFLAEWSPVVKNKNAVKNKILLSHDYYQPIETAVGKLKEKTNTSTKILGRINKLESAPDVNQRKEGKITVVYLDENEKKRIATIKLEKNDYDRAIEAHEKGLYVEIEGNLTKAKRTTMTCESFNIID
ncbi:MAG TPA: hypothetical protein H9717_16820 [Candidatus Eisenbergiella merdipullorum]|uniref:Uncharacterized protein n=1 Tax=Candidatus Eisenbergiella merdipullorum TaxID=2838553 RepID=A0A9D2I8K7_9FIRM|nr:hypothetical protein [Candidatus Eisenbergiella merdipullorum]